MRNPRPFHHNHPAAPLAGMAVAVSAGDAQRAAPIVRALHAAGARVALLGEEDCLRATAERLGDVSQACFWVPIDAGLPPDLDAALDDVMDRYAALDAVVDVVPMPPARARGTTAFNAARGQADWEAHVGRPLRQTQWLAEAALRQLYAARHDGLLVVVHAPDGQAAALEAGALGHALMGLVETLARSTSAHGMHTRLLCAADAALATAAPAADWLVLAGDTTGAGGAMGRDDSLANAVLAMCRSLTASRARDARDAELEPAAQAAAPANRGTA